MNYSLRLISSVALLLLVPACDDKGSLGEYPTTTTEGGSGSDGGETDGDTDGATSGATDGGSDSAGSDGSGGNVGCGPDFCQVFEIPCDDGWDCGGLGVFDESGCLRPSCGGPGQCGEGERCYRPQDFGGCAGSGFFCEDDFELEQCVCGGTADCGGAYCVPEELYPAPAAGPAGEVVVSEDCAPDDGPAFSFTIGLPSDACDAPAPPPGTPIVSIRLDYIDPAPGVHWFGPYDGTGWGWYDAGDGEMLSAVAGQVTISEWTETTVTGHYEITVEEGATHLGGDFEAAYCPTEPLCG